MPISHSELKRLLHYDPETGVWTWLAGRRKGKRADHPHAVGYRALKRSNPQTTYYSHRLAWFYTTGEWPPCQIDHRDTNRSNNKWDNLRLANQSQNQANAVTYSSNSSGYKGVFWAADRKRWRASIKVNYKKILLGSFESAYEAHLMYTRAARHYFGEFARVE